MPLQIQSNLLDGLVLSFIKHSNLYGYVLTQQVQDVLDVSESTIYPVLRRLRQNNYLTTYDKPYQGRNRRYYQITASGNEELKIIRSEWCLFCDKVNKVMGDKNEQGN